MGTVARTYDVLDGCGIGELGAGALGQKARCRPRGLPGAVSGLSRPDGTESPDDETFEGLELP
jgi:hypothetical protein